MQNALQGFKTSEECFPGIYVTLHKFLGKEKAKEMLTSAACAHFWKGEKFAHMRTFDASSA